MMENLEHKKRREAIKSHSETATDSISCCLEAFLN